MNPSLDHLLVAAIVLAAAFFLLRRFLPSRKKGKPGCGSDCGCGTTSKK
jgi:hypothetical protein